MNWQVLKESKNKQTVGAFWKKEDLKQEKQHCEDVVCCTNLYTIQLYHEIVTFLALFKQNPSIYFKIQCNILLSISPSFQTSWRLTTYNLVIAWGW